MPLTVPVLDDRKYQQILDEALARVPVHNPEWTNFNKSDPGVTLIEVFSFLTESLLFRANQIPERNRRKFLQLLGVALQPGTSARGLVSFSLAPGLPATFTLNRDIELRAGQVPFRTESGLDVLPVDAMAFYKRPVPADAETVAYYNQLYAALREATPPAELKLYEATLFSPRGTTRLNLGEESTDHSLWIALLRRPGDKDPAAVREALVGRTLSLGIVPALDSSGKRLGPSTPQGSNALAVLKFQIPKLPPLGKLSDRVEDREAEYQTLKSVEVPLDPTVVELKLPGKREELELWSNLDPLEAGTRDFPPSLEGTEEGERLITWIRVVPSAPAQTSLLWVGINSVFASQRTHVRGELLPAGTGEPDQLATLSHKPVLPGSVVLRVGDGPPWQEVDDLAAAGPEVPVPDLRKAPGNRAAPNPLVNVFALDAEAGQIRFGDGLRGARPRAAAVVRADYDYGAGRAGNVGPGAITSGPGLPASIKVTNALPTWGGADPETAQAAERQIPRFLQHRERLVNEQDFEAVALRTPGVAVGRVDVLSAYHPALSPNRPGNAPGAVTVMVLPLYDDPPNSGGPDTFLDAVACWLDPRRLVTTEVFVRRPDFQPIWVSIGLDLVAGTASAVVREKVKLAIEAFLSPRPEPGAPLDAPLVRLSASADPVRRNKGWPLWKPVVALELAAVANRVAGVAFVRQALLADVDGNEYDQIPMVGLELPVLAGISVSNGDATPIADLRGASGTGGAGSGTGGGGSGTGGGTSQPPVVPVPIIPEGC
ncbi:MAG TPA: baseplate J/gp47 family protein [Polyangiaceae bacterium]